MKKHLTNTEKHSNTSTHLKLTFDNNSAFKCPNEKRLSIRALTAMGNYIKLAFHIKQDCRQMKELFPYSFFSSQTPNVPFYMLFTRLNVLS